MHKLILAILLLNFLSVNGQSSFEFSQIDSIQGSKGELFVRAMAWMANTFNSAKSVIQMQDKEAGKIVGKAVIPWEYRFMGDGCKCSIHYIITIDCKDNKVRIVLSNFYHEGCSKYTKSGDAGILDGGSLDQKEQQWKGGLKGKKQKWWDDIRNTATKEANLIITSFRSEMQSPKLSTSDF